MSHTKVKSRIKKSELYAEKARHHSERAHAVMEELKEKHNEKKSKKAGKKDC